MTTTDFSEALGSNSLIAWIAAARASVASIVIAERERNAPMFVRCAAASAACAVACWSPAVRVLMSAVATVWAARGSRVIGRRTAKNARTCPRSAPLPPPRRGAATGVESACPITTTFYESARAPAAAQPATGASGGWEEGEMQPTPGRQQRTTMPLHGQRARSCPPRRSASSTSADSLRPPTRIPLARPPPQSPHQGRVRLRWRPLVSPLQGQHEHRRPALWPPFPTRAELLAACIEQVRGVPVRDPTSLRERLLLDNNVRQQRQPTFADSWNEGRHGTTDVHLDGGAGITGTNPDHRRAGGFAGGTGGE